MKLPVIFSRFIDPGQWRLLPVGPNGTWILFVRDLTTLAALGIDVEEER